jgi:hypothetical protein
MLQHKAINSIDLDLDLTRIKQSTRHNDCKSGGMQTQFSVGMDIDNRN